MRKKVVLVDSSQTAICPFCQEDYIVEHFNQKYCSLSCRKENYREQQYENIRKYRARHPEKLREQKRKWRDKNREKIIEQKRKWRDKNREKLTEETRRWVERNQEWATSYQRNYYEKNSVKLKEKSKREYRKLLGLPEDWDLSKESAIEVLMRKWLQEANIEFVQHHHISFENRFYTRVDFYIPHMNLCIYCDGDYWHSLPKIQERDVRINKELEAREYIVCRMTETDIIGGLRPNWIFEQYEFYSDAPLEMII